MQKTKIQLGQLNLIGLTVRTNNRDEMNIETSKIAGMVNQYLSENIADSFKNRINSRMMYAVYTEYESDEHGEYTYFIGEAVASLEEQDLSRFKPLIIPPSTYQKFAPTPGKMPDIVINAWQDIWVMNETDLEGRKTYIADFEIYDNQPKNPDKMAVDIYVGINDEG